MLYAKNRRKKGMSIRTKVVAWFAAFVVLIALLAILVVLYVTRNSFWTENENELRGEVTEFAHEITWSGDNVWVEDSYYEDDIVFSVYNDSGVCIGGIVPDSFSRDTVLKNGQVQQISSSERKWMTYDIALDNGENGHIWVRGIMYIGWGSLSRNGIFILTLVVFPALIALAVTGGWFITRRAFVPVEYIRTTAEKIAGSGDLTQRVPTANTGGELHELADTFNGMLDALQQSFEDEKQFTADVSHELRTPVSVMIAQGEYALLEDATDDERRDALTVMLGQAKKMSELISQMLFIARRERGLQEPEEQVDLGMAAQIAAEELTEQARQKNIAISVEADGNVCVQADQTGVMRITVNLLENAVEYGRTDGHVWVRVYSDGTQAVLCVRDDGIGIAPEHQPHIFKRFYRADTARTADERNHTGLGLAMVKLLTESYHGTIAVDSREGEGTTFTVRFPSK